MRVKHSKYLSTFEVIEQSENYYVCRSHYGPDVFVAPKSQYEPIPEERWVDVTGQVEVVGGDCQCSLRTIQGHRPVYTDVGYRFRKVEVPGNHFSITHNSFQWKYAFIVEKCEKV